MSAETQIPPVTPGLRRRAGLSAILLLLWSLFAAQPLTAQEGAVPEDQLKAAFLYNFARFVEWPASAFSSETAPLVLGVLGNDSFANTLANLLREKKAHGRPFVVRKLATANEASTCQMVFVAREESRKTTQVAEAVKNEPILTIGETDEILSSGGIIYLLRDDKQLRFDINVTAAEGNKLIISSHLLRLARKTKKSEGSK